MFAKVKERIDSTAKPASRPTGGNGGGASDRPMPSIVSRDMRVTGDLDTPGEVHVEGTVDGDIRCAKLIIGATGTVNGHILAATVRVHGQVRGEINAEEVFILNGSTVQGDVVQTLLEIATGASFEGAIRRRQAVAATAMLAAPVPDPAPQEPVAEAEPLLLATEPVETPAEEMSAPADATEPPEPANSGDDLTDRKAG
ncbi:polymer-forming cytoskeletal protein [Niveispirillum sp.]|uniref:bactofilin family protein n=1 Tax=Niveispirillum sp. TaxID=1917217 RepID=UPI001B5DCF34|nr:polymer-forming cytoskeletal protein [Niveispirillum sp.]MBP7338982.1 polymer-forming cytoskeletal protein [Niveispirillum sp.]